MTKREKIIVTIMCITVVWGIYMLFFSSESGKTIRMAKQGVDTLNEFVTDVIRKMKESEPSAKDRYVIEKAEKKWMKDPFLTSIRLLRESKPKADRPKENTSIQQGPDFIYSGYLSLGDRRLAIINGMEYEEGEALDMADHYVKKIYTNRVVIGQLNQTRNITVMLADTITTSN